MATPKNWLVNLVELGYLPNDDAELRLKKVALTLVPLIIGPAAFIWGSIYFMLDHPLSGSIPMSYSIISALSLYYFFKTKHTLFIQYSQLTLVLILPFLLMWSLGGFAGGSMVMIWSIFSPIAALMFLEKWSAMRWFLMYFVLIILSVVIDNSVAASVQPLPDMARNIFYLLNLGCGSAGLYLLVSYSNNEEKRAIKSDLRIAASAFEAQEALVITDAKGVILRINQAFTNTTGYTAKDVVGRTPRLLKSGRHNDYFYQVMWESIKQTGGWQGEVWDKRKNGEIYPSFLTISSVYGEDESVTHYVGAHLDITERKATEEKIVQMAFFDSLTQLPNRQLLLDRLHQALAFSARNGNKGALLFIDLDNFKDINDALGHSIGDLLLQQVAQRLTSCVRESDTVARLGGDEFVVMLENLSIEALEAAEQTEAIAEKILTALNQPFQLDTHSLRNSTSIGATLFSNTESNSEEILKQADIAMLEAKKCGRNIMRFFDPKMQQAIHERAALETELHKALELKEFQLYYQIQVDKSRHPIGAEALIRWIHPQRGIVSPMQFIPLAEETGLILPIGKWVLETACAQLKTWEADEQTRHLTLAVNICAIQFHQTSLVALIRDLVQEYEINPSLLKLELTESLLLEDIDETVATMKQLREIGIQLSLDDFGTGYSSLQYLKLLPLNQIKIDQSFVRNIASDSNDAILVQTIIVMSRALGLNIIAEGVETEEQREFLGLRGCEAYQGYLFGKPVDIGKFDAALKPD